MGSFKGISTIYWSFPDALSKWGYKINTSLFDIPYDYRYSSSESYEYSGFILELKDVVEKERLII